MNPKKLGIGAAALAAAGAIVVGGVTVSNASAATTPSTRVATAAADTTDSPQGRSQDCPGGAGQDTPVTGDEATKVGAAVTAKDSAVTVESVRKDPDGSYDVLGTKAGAKVMFDVSADLATVTENARPAGGGRGGPGGAGQDTPVTGDEATKVGAAVTAKDSAVTVESVRKDPDGSYDVLGTKAGAKVMFDVSADLATVTESVRPADGAGQRPQNGRTQQGQTQQGQTQQGQTQQGQAQSGATPTS
ncbi:MAG: hypothetical protein V9F82_07170 [Dermatophilaceae bacterium]